MLEIKKELIKIDSQDSEIDSLDMAAKVDNYDK
jgi:hypothetical protein